jgi:hypothetical protein
MIFRPTVVCLTVICGCCSQSLLAQNSTPSPTATPTLEQRVSDLEKRLQTIESIPGIALMLNLKNSTQANATPQPTPSPQTNAPLELVNWQYQYRPGKDEYQNRHVFSYVLKNRTEKAIKLVEGTIVFADLLGQMAIQLIPDVLVPAGNTDWCQGDWEVNHFEPNQQRLASLKHDDVKATLTVQKVVFSDNTVWSADNSQ